jgi:tRNA A37 methylthiotransferase MiaB
LCIIPYARGPLKSRQEKVISEIEKAIKHGYKELSYPIHLGLYGKDYSLQVKVKVKVKFSKFIKKILK